MSACGLTFRGQGCESSLKNGDSKKELTPTFNNKEEKNGKIRERQIDLKNINNEYLVENNKSKKDYKQIKKSKKRKE